MRISDWSSDVCSSDLDTGLRRTYPNWVSREGARGMEYNAWGSPPNPPSHEATLAFTRMLSGPMDFTPGIFDLDHNSRPPVRADIPRHDPANRAQTDRKSTRLNSSH